MKLLDPSQYFKLIKPLNGMTTNNLYALAVVEKMVMGTVYVDDVERPNTFYVVHPYGMSLLFGERDNDNFNSRFLEYALNIHKIRDKVEWLQAFPEYWNKKLSILFGKNLIKSIDNHEKRTSLIEENTRVNFRFSKDKYLRFRSKIDRREYKIIRTDEHWFHNTNGSVVPKYFWENASQFSYHGVGYSLILDNNVASTAFSSYIHSNQLELGIETLDGYRGRGLAGYTCASLIDYCLENDYEPVWSCRLENTGSYRLAQKLGFEPIIYIPYYRLNV